jgi:hypothetical protein
VPLARAWDDYGSDEEFLMLRKVRLSAACVASVFVATALVALGGCKGAPEPVRPADVEVYMPGDEVSERYQVLADIKKMASVETADSVLVMLAVAGAATYGG